MKKAMRNETEERLDEIKGRVEKVLDAKNDREKTWNGIYWEHPDHLGAFSDFDEHALPDIIWLLKQYTQLLSWSAVREKRLGEVKDERDVFYRMSFLAGLRFIFRRLIDRHVPQIFYDKVKYYRWRLRCYLYNWKKGESEK